LRGDKHRERRAKNGEQAKHQCIGAAAETHIKNGCDQEYPEAGRGDYRNRNGDVAAGNILGGKNLRQRNDDKASHHAEGGNGNA